MNDYLLISDAAKEVKVESHVLRYWEEELHLPIKRNELGHRYYTSEDVERFKQIKSMKERGLQLKAIKMILRDGKLDVIPDEDTVKNEYREAQIPIDIVSSRPLEREAVHDTGIVTENGEDKSRRLQWLLQQLIKETLVENNKELCRDIKENIIKELDYQFRAQEEREEERDRRISDRNEEYYKKMDELLRTKSAVKKIKQGKKAAKKNEKAEAKNNVQANTINMQSRKKKRHFIF
ncbi:MAG: helix-turn-helix domain-containing protein [Lachnospiraceae bacterium]|nr:helix-turn-helix domain-containing protein [Lachnospiraceae bacterium]